VEVDEGEEPETAAALAVLAMAPHEGRRMSRLLFFLVDLHLHLVDAKIRHRFPDSLGPALFAKKRDLMRPCFVAEQRSIWAVYSAPEEELPRMI
jgi:hypothetical protein